MARGMGFWRFGLKLHIRRTMVEGLLILVPVGITFLVLRFLFNFLDNFFLGPLIEKPLDRALPGVGIIALIILVYLAGAVWDIGLGRRLIQMGQRSLLDVPLVGAIYKPARQLIDSFSGTGESGFKRVVMIEYPKADTWMIGFLTATTVGRNDRPMGVVYVPTAPTPNSGWVAVVPIEDVYDTHLTVQEAMAMVLSGGISTPPEIRIRSLAELREQRPGDVRGPTAETMPAEQVAAPVESGETDDSVAEASIAD